MSWDLHFREVEYVTCGINLLGLIFFKDLPGLTGKNAKPCWQMQTFITETNVDRIVICKWLDFCMKECFLCEFML